VQAGKADGEAASGNEVAKQSPPHHPPQGAASNHKANAPPEAATVDTEPTVFKQGNDEIDLDLTQRIRKQLVADDALSFSSKNVKIITQDGVVTLRGSVKSEAEAKEIRKKAVAEAGQGRVQDHLEVSP